MGRFINGLFTARGKQAQQPASSLRVQTSVNGQPIPILLGGQIRMAANFIWYGNFQVIQNSSAGQGGGKGGLFSMGSGGGGVLYYATILFALCEGPISAVTALWRHGGSFNIGAWEESWDSGSVVVEASTFLGDQTQTALPLITELYPAQALNYRGVAYMGVYNFPLGSDPNIDTIGWEVRSTNSFVSPGIPDGDPAVALTSFLTDDNWGLGFPAARLGSLALWSSYARAFGLLVSPAITSSVSASSFVNDLLNATNSNAVWSGGLLTVVPYGDQAISVGDVEQVTEARTIPLNSGLPAGLSPYQILASEWASFVANIQVYLTSTGALFTQVPWGTAPGTNQYSVNPATGIYQFNVNNATNGVTLVYTFAATASYQPNTTPIYDLTIDDFLPNQGTIGTGLAVKNSPLIVVRRARDQMNNVVRVEYLDRTYLYNPVVYTVKNDAFITLYGRERPLDIKQYHFFCLGSAASYSAAMLLVRESIARTYQWTSGRQFVLPDPMDIVTVSDPNQGIFRQPVRITEIQENADRSLTFTAEEFPGTAAAPLYGQEASSGYQPPSNVDPGSVNPPLIFEPTAELLGGASLELWVALSGGPNWGGCTVWVSSDGGNTYRQMPGKVAGPARMGVTTSDLPTVAVNNVGQTIDQTHTLGVDLTESVGVLLSGSAADAQALRTACYLGGEVLAYETATLTATSKYNLSYLVRGAYGTEAAIVDHPAGTPFARLDAGIYQVPFAASDIGQTLFLKFASFNVLGGNQQGLADVPAYPYVIQGSALASPLPNIENLVSTFVDGRLAISWDEIASADFRTGILYEIRAGATFSGSVRLALVAHPPFVLPAGTNDYWVRAWCQPTPALLVYSETPAEIAVSNAQVETNIVASYDFKALSWPGSFGGGAFVDGSLNAVRTGPSSGAQVDGTYTPGNVIDCGYDVTTPVYATTLATGVPSGQNILTIPNILATPDILGAASAQYIDVYPEIAYGNTNPPTNWQTFVPGSYPGRYKQMRWQLETLDPNTIAYLLGAGFAVDVPDRTDHPLVNGSLTSSGLSITFQPDGAASTAPFHGGPNGSTNPAVVVTWSGADAAQGDFVKVTSLSLSGCTVTIFNSSGTAVTRSQVSISVVGW